MRLLLDSDVLCKLGAAGLLEATTRILGVEQVECRRLPALPHMLRRGRLRHWLGNASSDALLPTVEGLQPAPAPSAMWADLLVDIPDIDPGEAQLLALTAEHDVRLLTGDKRALSSVRRIPRYPEALCRKVVILEMAVLRLCETLTDASVRRAMGQVRTIDKMLGVVFSDENPSPRDTLQIYIDEARGAFAPIEMWGFPPQPLRSA